LAVAFTLDLAAASTPERARILIEAIFRRGLYSSEN
jgi:hypothetical protein